MSVKVRFAPSPTGYLHVGGLRTALYNYLYAKKVGGKMVLRIEDTDQNRKVDGAVENLISSFNQMGLKFDEGPTQGGDCGPYFQSQRLDIYNEHIKLLLDSGDAYPCFCSAERLEKIRENQKENKETIKYDRHCLSLSKEEAKSKMQIEPHIIRMRIPDEEEVVFYDMVRERVAIKTEEIDDQVLIKTDGFPTYHFANIVDDHLMGITHVMRGEEWLPSTPKHVLLYRFFGWKSPKFVHLPLLLNSDKSKLSKRQGDVAVEDYLKKGYLVEALLNFIVLLGWHPNSDRELFLMPELEKEFSVKRILKAGSVFDVEKLNWMNAHYLKEMDLSIIADRAKPYFETARLDISDTRKYHAVVDNARKRINTLPEMIEHSIPFYKHLEFSEDDKQILSTESSKIVFNMLSDKLTGKTDLSEQEIKKFIKETGEETSVKGKDLFIPIRLALFGEQHGPDIALVINILGIEESIKRLNNSPISK
jgi:nondiscriminating glutamyl-tRNA synthetase